MLILIKLLLSNGNIGLIVIPVCTNLHFLKSGKIDSCILGKVLAISRYAYTNTRKDDSGNISCGCQLKRLVTCNMLLFLSSSREISRQFCPRDMSHGVCESLICLLRKHPTKKGIFHPRITK